MDKKLLHDKIAGKERQTGPLTVPDLETAYKCLNRARKRMSTQIPGSAGEESFQHALDSSEGVEMFTIWENGNTEEHRTFVRNLKDNWQQDTKYIDAIKDIGFKPGNTVTWKRLGVKWLIVWQDFIYKDFFRGEMYRANHLLKWHNEKGEVKEQWASIRGPVETKAKYDNVAGNYEGGRQNDTLDLWIGNNDPENIKSLSRYSLVKVGNRTWRIGVIDDVSNPNVLRMSLIENFNNDYTDDVILGIPDSSIIVPDQEEPNTEIVIMGPTKLKEGLYSTFEAFLNGEALIGDWSETVNEKLKTEQKASPNFRIKAGRIGDKTKIKFTSIDGSTQTIELTVVSVFG